MKQKGILLTCDRCGKTEFLKKLEGPYSRACSEYIIDGEVYQEPGYNWTEREIRDEKKNLCPRCSEIFEDFEKEFFREHNDGKWRIENGRVIKET